jgi:DNA-binding transcriptional LysR family regulator
MNRIKDNEIAVFMDLIKTGSFSKTASNLSVSQASVSKIINGLENRMGLAIFDRDNRPVRLTGFGQELLPFIETYISSKDALLSFSDKYKTSTGGVVRIYAPTGAQIFLTRNALPQLRQRHPDIKISLKSFNPPRGSWFTGVEYMDDCDILISWLPPKSQSLIARKLEKIRLNVYATDEFYQKHPFKSLDELKRHPFILLESVAKEPFSNYFEIMDNNTGDTESIEVSGNVKCDNGYVAREFCRRGLGYLVYSDLPSEQVDGIKPRLDDRYSMTLQLYAIYKKRTDLPMRVKTALDFLIDAMGKIIPNNMEK